MIDRPAVAVFACCELFADAMRAALEGAGIAVAMAAPLSEDAIHDLRGSADVVVLDAGTANEAIPWIRRLRESGEVRGIVAIIEGADDARVVAVLEAGASGWIDRESSLPQLIRAVRSRHTVTSARIVAMVGDRIHALARDFAAARHVSGDDWSTTGRRFEETFWKAFATRRKNRDMCRGPELADVADISEHFYAGALPPTLYLGQRN